MVIGQFLVYSIKTSITILEFIFNIKKTRLGLYLIQYC